MTDQQLELLMSRLAAEDGGEELWERFKVLAESRPELWREMIEMQREQRALSRALHAVESLAEDVQLPCSRPAHRGGVARSASHGLDSVRFPALRWLAGAGWAVAAVLALIVLIRSLNPAAPVDRPVPPNVAAVTDQAPSTPAEALQAYFDLGRASGQVVAEMPTKVLLDARPSPTGDGYQVLYLRQMLEQMTVPDLYHVEGEDEWGQPTLVRWEQPVDGAM